MSDLSFEMAIPKHMMSYWMNGGVNEGESGGHILNTPPGEYTGY